MPTREGGGVLQAQRNSAAHGSCTPSEAASVGVIPSDLPVAIFVGVVEGEGREAEEVPPNPREKGERHTMWAWDVRRAHVSPQLCSNIQQSCLASRMLMPVTSSAG
ncbi:hypothetical protein MUK42_34727 [Musa troglodytarum]|uniref:Uncharacterized protein n=1 Tax=Musa troglodytarum TaxID=320322 RepID=A0A9E7JT84_9LILI|nr:hypothetical protein MUK42_34727 [Musa troglodytarum]